MRHHFILVVMILAAMMGRPAEAADGQVELVMGTAVGWKVGKIAGQYIYWDQQGHSWTVKLVPGKKVDGKPQAVTMTVSADGIKPASLSIDIENSADSGTLAVYDFDAGLPTFLTTHYTMGAHCCYDVQAVVFNGKKLVVTDVDSYDGGVVVRDIDGDGTWEIDTVDQRFLYAFDDYAASRAAREIDKVKDSGRVNVTGDIEYQPYLMAELGRELAECTAEPRPGYCAGPLGTAAELGIYQSAASEVPFKQIDDANKDATYLTCSKEQCGVETKFWNYREALEYQLNDWGYNTDTSMDAPGRAFFRRLAAFGKGFGETATTGAPCGEEAFRVRMGENEQFAEVDGQEYACRIEKATILHDAAIALGLCTGEGENFSTIMALELDGDRLYSSFIDKGAVNTKVPPATLTACR